MIETNGFALKLDVAPADVARLEKLASSGSRRRGRRLATVGYDTPDRALREAGFSLRVYNDGGRFTQRVGSYPGSGSGVKTALANIAGPGPDSQAAAVRLKRAALGRGARNALAVVFEIDIERRSGVITRGRSKIAFAVDHGTIRAAGRTLPVCEATLSLPNQAAGRRQDLFGLARDLGASTLPRVALVDPTERGYRLADGVWDAPPRKTIPALTPDLDAGEAFIAICHACLTQFALCRPAFDAGAEIEAVHQSRVAIRRLRAALSLFKPVARGDELDRLKIELAWFSGLLGETRDLDVLATEALAPSASDPGSPPPTDELIAHVEAQRTAAHGRLKEALASQRLDRLMFDLVQWIEDGEWRRSHDPDQARERGLSVAGYAARHLSKRMRKFARAEARIADFDSEEMHQFRIRAKKLRYMIAFFQPLATEAKAEKRLEHLSQALEEVQDALGLVHDGEDHARFFKNEALAAAADGREPSPLLLAALTRLDADRPDVDQLIAKAARAARKAADAKPFWEWL